MTTEVPKEKKKVPGILGKGLIGKVKLDEQELLQLKTETHSKKDQTRIDHMLMKNVGNSNVGELLKKLEPVITVVNNIIDVVTPIAMKVIEKVQFIQNVLPLNLAYALLGLFIAFFGGAFDVTLSAVEAFYASGVENVVNNLNYLIKEFKILWKKSREDDEKDEDGDGIKDVLQISAKELVTRKIGFFFANCSDPQMIMDMFYGIFNSLLAVIAVLKVKFAKVIALGMAIGENLKKPASYILVPIISTALPKKYHQWISPVINMVCKSVAVTIAWMIQRVISSVQASIRGGLMCSRSLMAYTNERGWTNFDEEETYLDEIVGWTIAAIGLYFQLIYFFGLPFPLNVLLGPISIFENILIWIISD